MHSKTRLTPKKLIGERFSKNTFGNMRVVILGYCPPPTIFKKYNPIKTTDQHFILQTPDSVEKCSYNGLEFLHLTHIYGGSVSSAIVEELAYYGFDYILAYGLAGGLKNSGLKIGEFYLAESSFVYDGTTPHYTKDKIIFCDRELKEKILSARNDIKSIRVMTNDAIYRENDALLQLAEESGCGAINLDVSHLYAVSGHNHEDKKIKAIQCGVISNIADTSEHVQGGSLSSILSDQQSHHLNPITRTGDIVTFYVEKFMPELTR